jgi:hypothetical protein
VEVLAPVVTTQSWAPIGRLREAKSTWSVAGAVEDTEKPGVRVVGVPQGPPWTPEIKEKVPAVVPDSVTCQPQMTMVWPATPVIKEVVTEEPVPVRVALESLLQRI